MSGSVVQETKGKDKDAGKSCANGHLLTKIMKWNVCTNRDCMFYGSTGAPLKGLDDEIRRLLSRSR